MTRILHISDLHLQTPAQAERALGQLHSDLAREMEVHSVNAIVVSGDNTEFASPPEYEVAAGFVIQLCDMMKVARENLLVVPGNHDVDWQAARASYTVVRTADAPPSSISRFQDPANRDYVEVVTDADRYRRRFDNYAQYHHTVTSRDYGAEYEKQFEIVTSDDKSVLLMGLNSAWNLDHHHPDRSSIEVVALTRALVAAGERSREIEAPARIVACWHHPIHGDGALKDNAFLQRLIVDGVSAVLHGHVHRPVTERLNYEWNSRGRRIFVLGAGTLDSPDVHRGYPWHYSVVSIEGSQLQVRSRSKSERDGAWQPDARYLMGRNKLPADVLYLDLVTSAADSVAKVEPGVGLPGTRSEPLRTVSALKAHLEEHQYNPLGYRLAVEALIFDPNGKLLLQERGPECRDEVGSLECLGGQVSGEDLIECTISRVRELVGKDVRIQVDELLDVQPARFVERHGPEDWIVVGYLCRLVGGEPRPVNPGKTAALRWLDLSELHAIDDNNLSRSTSRHRDVYRVKFRMNPYFSRAGRLA